MSDKIEKISKIATQKIKPEVPEGKLNRDYFEALMNQKVEKPEAALTQNEESAKESNSLLDEVRNMNHASNHISKHNPDALIAQAQDVISQIDTLKSKLETPNLQIKGSVQTILRNKLEHIDESLKIALSKAGGEQVPSTQPSGLMQPIDRFLGLLSHGQNQLETIAGDINTLQAKGNELSPASMLLIQIKVAHVQQEIELFTNMLNKALESTKTIMNVQV